MVQTQFKKSIKCIRSDNGQEFIFPDFYNKHGIVHQRSCVATLQQNGIVECKHQHILQVTRSILFHSGLPLSYWSDSVLTVVHVINRVPSSVLQGKIPYEILYATPVDYSYMRVFGSLCYVSTLNTQRHKIATRAVKCVFLGCKFGVKGYKCLALYTKQVLVSRDVIFKEDKFPFKTVFSFTYITF